MAPPYCFQPMYDPPFFHGEEDCLYLNIFTSKVKDRDISLKIRRKMFNGPMKYKNWQVTEEKGLVDEEQLPVMVWIHGGAFRIGQTSKLGNPIYLLLFSITRLVWVFILCRFLHELQWLDICRKRVFFWGKRFSYRSRCYHRFYQLQVTLAIWLGKD